MILFPFTYKTLCYNYIPKSLKFLFTKAFFGRGTKMVLTFQDKIFLRLILRFNLCAISGDNWGIAANNGVNPFWD